MPRAFPVGWWGDTSTYISTAAGGKYFVSSIRRWKLYWGKNKDRYNDRYRESSVRWCSIVDVACHAIVLLSISMGMPRQGQCRLTIPKGVQLWSEKCYPSQYLGSRWRSARDPLRRVILGDQQPNINSHRPTLWPGKDLQLIRLIWSRRIYSGDWIFSTEQENEPTCSRASRSLVSRWSPASEKLHHQHSQNFLNV